MSFLRAALRSNYAFSALQKSNGLPFLLRVSPRWFSTSEAQQPPQDSTENPFFGTPDTGLVYGRLQGVNRHTLKTDIINLLEGCNLTLEDVKVDYSRGGYMPLAMMLQFPSRSAYEQALRVIGRKGRLYKLERADRAQWDIVTPYDGKTILLQGIPRNAIAEDVERFLSGCEYDPTSLNFFTRAGDTDPIRMATVRFPEKIEATNAYIKKNGSFCLNNRISVRVLQ
ncbi:hypothetical protein L6164_009851 [Bauhinia variegata]|uniref:Uncharacterized protein n=1 Tax=Bauhinia variegata TaxID=167791 RepID=A0ACB9PMI8_BAUVA|nr:hypothetical protein L6164_009851 [Bauhinia variegata]